jgi:hypothetical protein
LVVLSALPVTYTAAAANVIAQQLAGERPAAVTGIPGVIEPGATWELVWADFETADGIVGTTDGGVIFAQEQTDTIRKLDVSNKELVFLTDTHVPPWVVGLTAAVDYASGSAQHGDDDLPILMLAEGYKGRPK